MKNTIRADSFCRRHKLTCLGKRYSHHVTNPGTTHLQVRIVYVRRWLGTDKQTMQPYLLALHLKIDNGSDGGDGGDEYGGINSSKVLHVITLWIPHESIKWMTRDWIESLSIIISWSLATSSVGTRSVLVLLNETSSKLACSGSSSRT